MTIWRLKVQKLASSRQSRFEVEITLQRLLLFLWLLRKKEEGKFTRARTT